MSNSRELTPGEVVFTMRRRLPMSQADYAARHAVSRHTLSLFELDKKPCKKLSHIKVGKKLKAHEWCVLIRRRRGETMNEVAAKMGCSKYWIHLMETGRVKDISALCRYCRVKTDM